VAEKDYSGTPLWKKLGLKEDARFGVLRAPRGFAIDVPAGVRSVNKLSGAFNVLLLFETRVADVARRFRETKKHLVPDGGLWVAFPKTSSAIETDLTFESVQRVGLDAGLVDNKSCAIDDDWSAVRFVYRLKDR
jgi:hypothetical protein